MVYTSHSIGWPKLKLWV